MHAFSAKVPGRFVHKKIQQRLDGGYKVDDHEDGWGVTLAEVVQQVQDSMAKKYRVSFVPISKSSGKSNMAAGVFNPTYDSAGSAAEYGSANTGANLTLESVAIGEYLDVAGAHNEETSDNVEDVYDDSAAFCMSATFTKKECTGKKVLGSDFCEKHSCPAGGCNRLKSSGKAFCKRHSNA